MWQIVEGINPAMTFRLRSHQEVDLHKPDIRSTIHWVPTVTTDAGGKAEIEFFHSDDTGVISVVVQGRTKDGRSFQATRSFRAILK
jgi:hypothetical protein